MKMVCTLSHRSLRPRHHLFILAAIVFAAPLLAGSSA